MMRVYRGFLGFFAHPFVEVEAMPPRAQPRAVSPAAPRQLRSALYAAESPARGTGASGYLSAHLAALASAGRRSDAPPAAARPPGPPHAPVTSATPPATSATQRPTPANGGFTLVKLAPAPTAPLNGASERRSVPAGSLARARAGVEKSLVRLGVSDALARELSAAAAAHTLPLAPRLGLAQAVRMEIAQRIPVAAPLPAGGATIVLVGAGGAGKTTFCAALLGAYRSASTLPASFASLIRGAEGGELDLIMSPHMLSPTPAGSARALRALRTARREGLAVIDTPRLSPTDRAGVRDLARLLGELEPERIVVALPASAGPAAAEQLLGALRPLGANALALTHVDETDQIGIGIEAACRFELAPEYVLEHGLAGGWRLNRVDPAALAAKLLP